MYYLNKTALLIVNPVTFGMILMVMGIVLVSGFRFQVSSFRFQVSGFRKRLGIGLIVGAMGWFCIWSMGVTQRLMGWVFGLDRYRVVEVEDLPKADYIVDLGGGMGLDTNVCVYPYLAGAADRVWHSARLWKAGKASFVIPTGIGIADTDAVFLKDLGVSSPAILVENQARNTEENAIYNAALIERHWKSKCPNVQAPKPQVLLVTSVSHMRRALMIFRKKAPNLVCIPVVTDCGSVNFYSPWSWNDFVPHVGTLAGNMVVYKECLGILGYKVRGF